MEGLIIKNISNDYVVLSGNHEYICKARGKLKNDNIIPIVGDNVIFDNTNNYILNIKKRENELIRPRVANISQAFIVTSVKDPLLDTNLLDKLLTIITYNNIKPIICFSKLDLTDDVEEEKINKIISYYENIGYEVVNNKDKKKIKELLKNKITVFTGQSGAGKSTLINYLDKNLNLKTDDISKSLGRGKHTTRHTELYKIYDGFVVDTPGFSLVDLSNLSKTDIRDNMLEMFDNLHKCKYRDCMHINEDNCEVKRLVDNGIILKSRYDNYKKFIGSR